MRFRYAFVVTLWLLIFLIVLLELFGCASIPQTLDPAVFYKRDMTIKVNGKKAEGVLVVPRASKSQ